MLLLATFSVLTLAFCVNAQSYFIAAPNVFRVNVDETIYIRFAYPTQLELYVQDPRSSKVISRITRNLQPKKPDIVKLKIKDSDLPSSWKIGKIHFNLIAKGPGLYKQTPILLDLKGATVFIQTDKPIYTPGEKVKYRIIPVDMNLRPLKENVTVEIKNPQGIRVRKERNVHGAEKGFHHGDFNLGDIPVLGKWQITAFFGVKNAKNSSSTFVVKKYVLPTFRVRIKPPPFVAQSKDMNEYAIKITAKYSYGKNVNGLVRLRTFVIRDYGKKEILIDDQNSPINGEESYSIKLENFLVPKEISSMPFGSKLKILAEVTERATGTKEFATDNSVNIVKSPFIISFEKTAKYFKPGINFKVVVMVKYPNKRPVQNEELKYQYSYGNAGKPEGSNVVKVDGNGNAYFTINTPNEDKNIHIKVETKSTSYENAKKEMVVKPYISAKGNYIAIRAPETHSEFKVGSNIALEFLVSSKEFVDEIIYMVIAKGKVIYSGQIRRKTGIAAAAQLKIEPEMAPKCRIVAFYVKNGEMTSDSVLLDIEDGYENEVSIKASPDPQIGRFAPALPIQMKITASSKSTVGLLAVDESVYYLRNESRLTTKTVFTEIGNFDLGCGLGSGKNNGEVFENAGLAVITDSALPIKKRNDLSCSKEQNSRRRRSVTPENAVSKCCKGTCCQNFYFARRRLPKKIECEVLRSRVEESCWNDFLACCQKLVKTRGRTIDSSFGQDKDSIPVVDEGQINLRDSFPQSWMWLDFETRDDGILARDFTAPDSITTWEITALAMNNKTGFGLSKPLKINSYLEMFIHVKMPFSAQRYEQVTVYAVIYNFFAAETFGSLYLKGHETFCSIAEAGKKSPKIIVKIPANDGIAIPFTIIPMQIGEIDIEFVLMTNFGHDRIIKKLIVVPEGVQEQSVSSFLLDPQGVKQDKKKLISGSFEQVRKNSQVNSKDLKLPDPFVPDSQKAMVYVTGNLMSAGVQEIISNGLTNLIRLPTGCGEQTMISMAPLVYVLRYLYSIKNGVTAEIERRAYDFMRKGYNNELKWRRSDHSYSVWGIRTPPSTWLTAFVNKVFCQATRYIKDDIDNNVICDTLKFLEKIQKADGSFSEGYAVRHREMIGGVNSELSLTAFVLISLMECNPQCVNADSQVIIKASGFLVSQVQGIKSGYIMSLVSYALVITNSPRKKDVYKKLNEMLTEEVKNGRVRKYIKDGGPALQVESTAYTLLAMVALNKVDDAGPLVVWLTEQRNARGSFYSTQDTVVALHALSEYCSKTSGGELDLRVTITAGKETRKTLFITNENALVRQEFEITNAIPGRVTIDTVGKGTAQLQIELTYNRPQKKDENCEYEFEVKTSESSGNKLSDAVRVKNWKNDDKFKKDKKKRLKKCKRKCRKNHKNQEKKKKCVKKCKEQAKEKEQGDQVPNRMNIDVCLSHKFSNGSSMTIAEVGLLTGFTADEASLKSLISQNRDPRIKYFEISDRFVVFYLEKIPQVKSCFSFLIVRKFDVGILQSVPVIVYDYYEPGNKCTKFYGPKPGSELLKTICDGKECICSQGICAESRSTDPKELKEWACFHSDFVLVGQVRGIEPQGSLIQIALRIIKVYKKGKKEFVVGNKLLIYQRASCNHPKLEMGKKVVIMLRESRLYLLNKDAYILKWPANAKKAAILERALKEVEIGHKCG